MLLCCGLCRSCDTPPDLNKFTPYRDDKKDGLKFYTDPNYFYDLWVKDQNKLLEKKKKKVRERLTTCIDRLMVFSYLSFRVTRNVARGRRANLESKSRR